ncbi:hypothetical protein C3L33_21755, partial [Rhododendron williamsianum]
MNPANVLFLVVLSSLKLLRFTSDVKIKSISVVGGADGTSPSKMRAFINREGIDFSDAQNMQPIQEWDLAENLQGVLEYQTKYSRFQGVGNLTLHFPDNFGGDATQIHYIGLKGEATQLKRDVVATIVYELMPNPSDHKCESSFIDHGLSEADPHVRTIIDKEKQRQFRSLELIASENFTSRAVMEAVGSCLTNKYSEGLPAKAGNSMSRKGFGCISLRWKEVGVNVQPLSGSPANFEVYTALLNPHDRIMADESTGIVDYDMLEKTANLFRPKLIIAGASAYPRDFDYPRMRKIADAVGAFLMMDMAHISGLVAASVVADPFEYCDVVTTTTHKGGPHNHTIGGLAVCLNYAQSPEFRAYQNKVVSNCRALANRLIELGYKLVSGGTDNHLVLVDLRPLGIDGARVEKILDMSSITLNKNSVPGDKSAQVPGGIRIGSPAMTTRGFTEKEFIATADFIHEGVKIALEAKRSVSGSKLQDFMKFIGSPDFALMDLVSELRMRVEALTTQFPLPGL